MSATTFQPAIERSYAVSDFYPLLDSDSKLKAAILKNEAIRNNLRRFQFDPDKHVKTSAPVFNLLVHDKLEEINSTYHLCANDDIVKEMVSPQWILSFLLRAATDDTVSTVARKRGLLS